MMEIPGFTPSRRVEQTKKGWRVYVTPPTTVGRYPEVSVLLSDEQYSRYLRWRNEGMMIQEALPELSVSEREKLMTGLGDADFQRIARDPDEDV
jgi:hypothetical protein